MRVTTRLQDSLLPYDTIHPILLPGKDRLTDLYILKVHQDNGHVGIPQTLSLVRAEFWIPQGRRAVKYLIRRCNPCLRVSGPFYSRPKHPPLPDIRVQRARVFKNVGVDFVGPVTIRNTKYDEWRIRSEKEKKRRDEEEQGVKRSTRSSKKGKEKAPPKPKAYMLTFTCAGSRTVHFEATLGQTVDDFLMGLQRFMNLRGIPEVIICDNAKSFIRASKELNSIYKSARVRKLCEQKRIKFQFYTERSPWMGGLHERLNALFKDVCKKTFGKAILSFDEYRTMVSYAMAIVNDRPLTYVYSDIDSAGTEITPSMLMSGYKLNEPPHLSWRKPKDESEMKLGERYVLLEKLKDGFWKRWYKGYLTALTERHVHQGKVQAKFIVPKENEVVLVKDESASRREWKLGRVLHVRKSLRDGQVREVHLITTNKSGKRSFLKRSPTFLVPLEVGTEYITQKVRTTDTDVEGEKVSTHTDTKVKEENNQDQDKPIKKTRFDDNINKI